ncbi:MAG: carboxypeptidase regulatory-like domain-containing protein, partial [Sarcina sp.]
INFVLQTDINATLGAISGVVKDVNSNSIYGGIVLLYNIDSGTETLVAISYTDKSGIFVFSELVSGMYKVTLNALGYMQGEVNTTVKSGNITTVAKVLYVNPEAANGIVSGIITDANKNPVANADVILYSVENNNSLVPVSFTQTNLVGIYTFINVPSGTYLVKSNQSQLITVDPATIPTTINTTTTPLTTIPTTINTTTNPSQVSTNLSLNQFNFKGYNWLTIDILQFDITNKKLVVNSTGNQAHQYLSNTLYFGVSLYDSNNNLKASVFLLGNDKGDNFANTLNGLSFEYGDYLKIYHNEPWRLELLGPVSGAPIGLSSGFNNIDLNQVNLYIQPSGLQYVTVAPALNSYIPTNSVAVNTNAISGTLSNNAIAVLNNNFVGALGEAGGYVTIPITVSTPGVYKLAIQYLSGDNDRLLQIDVNKKNIGSPYIAIKTDDWTAESAKILNIMVNLNTISNEIKIYNKPNAKAPWIGNLTFTTTTPPNLVSNKFTFKG